MSVMMPRKKPDMIQGSLGTIGSAVGGIVGTVYGGPGGGAAGSQIGGMVGGAAADKGQQPQAISPAERRMTKLNSRNEFAAAQQSLQNINDPELKSIAEPIIQEALKRSEAEEKKRQSLRRSTQNGTSYQG